MRFSISALVLLSVVSNLPGDVSAFQSVQLSSKASSFVAPLYLSSTQPAVTTLSAATLDTETEAVTTDTEKEEDDPYALLLLDAITDNGEAATVLLDHIKSLDDKKDAFLDSLLQSGPDATLPFWTTSRRMARTSKRARWASLRRILNMASPSRRQALVAVLETIADMPVRPNKFGIPTVVRLEKKAMQGDDSWLLSAPVVPEMDVESMMNDEASVPPSVVAVAEEEEKVVETEETAVAVVAVEETEPKKTWRDRISVVIPKPIMRRLSGRQAAALTPTDTIDSSSATTTTDFEFVAAPRDPATDSKAVVVEKEEEEKEENLMQQIKDAGTAGVVSYALWEFGFWAISVPICIVGYQQVTGHWPDLTNADDQAKLGAEAFAFVNFARFAVPLRIGLALGTTPWIQENIVDRFFNNDDKEETKE
ncbi:Protein of unknown function (DUF2499) [Seminavis robusta]|uniref:Uncharacterized protein n=1 Tax=Seminavis robusta TaxID=568900 RepID=A0A9N8DHB2_9STRA|nr:Protein of unknown function (DUF2499) [Seminavis robusta]|eukprot:Sro145_g067200.1 Protein of unknown function (DUF2499) (423) ;mRNA; r:12658-14126